MSENPRETAAQTLTEAVKAHALQLGFQLVGVTTPDPPAHLDVYLEWLAAGQHAGMSWMASDRARERRADPQIILPGCKSILVLGIASPPPPPLDRAKAPDAAGGRVAAYAQGEDYHDVLPMKLEAIVAFIQEQSGTSVPHRWYTDTGPILERELAQRAGLGWIGKNTCLINPEIGSYTLLAEIFLGIALEPDPAFQADRCGRCRRCLEACPTGCILPNRTLDASRCISYLTIEHKGMIPGELRPQMGDWIFGCDLCQQVCPWNRDIPRAATSNKDRSSTQTWLSPRADFPPKSLASELRLTPQEFNAKFKGSPVKRAKRRGYLRNVATAVGNRLERAAVPELIRTLGDPEPLIRAQSAWALGKIGEQAGLAALKQASGLETHPDVLGEIQVALNLLTNLAAFEDVDPGRSQLDG